MQPTAQPVGKMWNENKPSGAKEKLRQRLRKDAWDRPTHLCSPRTRRL